MEAGRKEKKKVEEDGKRFAHGPSRPASKDRHTKSEREADRSRGRTFLRQGRSTAENTDAMCEKNEQKRHQWRRRFSEKEAPLIKTRLDFFFFFNQFRNEKVHAVPPRP